MTVRTGSVFDRLEQLGSGSNFAGKLVDLMEKAEILRDLSRAEIEVLADYIQAYTAPVGVTVLREGDKESFMFVLAEGRLDILKNTDTTSTPKRLATVRAGKTVGEMSIIDGLPHSATAVVAEKATLLLITRRNFERYTEEHPQSGMKLLKKIAMLMSLRLRQTSGVLVDYIQG